MISGTIQVTSAETGAMNYRLMGVLAGI